MIKIFRNIRQNLINKGKTTKYFQYAIGEIILVMIGILLALQVNNWNNDRAERKQEEKFLIGLKADLQVDLVNMKAFIEDKKIKQISALKVLEFPELQTANDVFELDSLIWNVFIWRSYHPSTNTMDELISSGSLNIIKNDSIKTGLLNIKQKNSLVADGTEHMRREYDYYLYDRSAAIRELMPFLDLKKYIESDTVGHIGNIHDKNLPILKEQLNSLLQDQMFRNGLKLAILNNHGMAIKCKVMYKELEELINMIDKEIHDK